MYLVFEVYKAVNFYNSFNNQLYYFYMKSKGQNYKINQVISLSQNYKLHRQHLQGMKSFVNSNNTKRQQSISKLAEQRLRYRQSARKNNQQQFVKQNLRMASRIAKASQSRDRRRKSLQSSQLRYSRANQTIDNKQEQQYIKEGDKALKTSRSQRSTRTLRSMSSSRSLSSVTSNFRERTRRQKQIYKQNMKLAQRITNPKSNKSMERDYLNTLYKKQQQHMRIRSRFSQRNQQIMKTLALQGLKFDRRDVQYLPQLTNKRYNQNNSQNNKIKRPEWNSTTIK